MTTTGFELKVSGASFAEVVNTMRNIVDAADKLTPATGATTTKRGKKSAKTETEADETQGLLDMSAGEETDATEETETTDDSLSFDAAEETPAPAPTKKSAKITEKDVNAAAMAHAKKHTRPKTLAVLQKNFKVKSILELKPEQYAAAIKALAV